MNSITFFLFFIPILALILLGLNLIFAPHNPYQEKSSTFECGFHSFLGQNRTQFNISFFIFGLLFLTFDLELVMALPGLITIYTISGYGISIMLIFFVILTIGFAFELGKKALSIDSKQYSQTIKSSFQFVDIAKNIVIVINISIKDYYNKFNLFKLSVGFIKLRVISFFIAYIFLLINIISVQDFWHTSSQLILFFIIYKFIYTPWNNHGIPKLFITLLLNSIVLFTILYLIKYHFNVYGFDMHALILLSVSLDISDWSISNFDRMPHGSDPQGSGSNNGGPGGSGGPEGPGDPNPVGVNGDYKGSKILKHKGRYLKNDYLSPKELEDRSDFVKKWNMADNTLKDKMNKCIENESNLPGNTIDYLLKLLRGALREKLSANTSSEFQELKKIVDDGLDFYKKGMSPQQIEEQTKSFNVLHKYLDDSSREIMQNNSYLLEKANKLDPYCKSTMNIGNILNK